MDDLPIKKPKNALNELYNLIIPKNITEDASIQLIVCINDENLSIRDLSAFLELIDHIYGRLTTEGFQSYAQRKHRHLRISKVKQGSCELIIETLLSYLKQSEILLIIWLALKYLPKAIQTMTTSYNQYEQARLARENRKRIRMEIEEDKKLHELPLKRRSDLAKLIDILYMKEFRNLPRSIRFARKSLLDVDIRINKKNIKNNLKNNSQ